MWRGEGRRWPATRRRVGPVAYVAQWLVCITKRHSAAHSNGHTRYFATSTQHAANKQTVVAAVDLRRCRSWAYGASTCFSLAILITR